MDNEEIKKQAANSLHGKVAKWNKDYAFGDWKLTETGVTKQDIQTTNHGAYSSTKVASPIPVIPSALLQNKDSKIEKVVLTFFKYGKWCDITVDRSTIASHTAIVKLSDMGLEVSSITARSLVEYLSTFIALNLNKLPHYESKSSMGWVDTDTELEFMPYSSNLLFDADDNFKYLYNAIDSKGDFDKWKAAVGMLRNNLLLRLCVDASLSSVLVELVGENPFVFHLWGGSGSGKTVALMVAMSVWGNPSVGQMVRTMNMSANSMLSTAAFLKHLPFAGDELQTIKSRWEGNYDNLIMCITEGIDRGRMSFDKINEIKSWKNCFLFTGEENCVKASSGGGARNRVISCECTEKVIEEGNKVVNFIRSNYGLAGKPYIEWVRQNVDSVKKLYTVAFNLLMNKANANTTDKQASAMALLWTADEIAKIVFWENERPLELKDLTPFLQSEAEVDVTVRAYEYICGFVYSHQVNFESDSGREQYGFISDRKVFFLKQALDKILSEAGFDLDACKYKWAKRGQLIKDARDRYTTRFNRNGASFSSIVIMLPEIEED